MPDVICAIVQNGKSPIEGGTRSAKSMSGRNLLTADDRAYYDIDGTDIPVEAMQEFQDDFEESVELPEGHGGGVRVEDPANNSDSDADHEEVNENLGGVSDQEAGDALVEEPVD
jgi:hypothetical protein